MGQLIEKQEANGQAQEKRVTKALLEGPEYQWRKGPAGWVVETPSGGCYQVSEKGCTCMDYQRTCSGVELSCKHQVALRIKLLAETAPAPPAPAEKQERLPLMTDAEVARWDRLYA